MGDSIFVVLPEGAKLTKKLEVMLAPEEFDLKTKGEKQVSEINRALKKLELRIYGDQNTLIAKGKYANHYTRNGNICAVYEINGANHNAT